MSLEHHVTSLELSKRLKELGVKQESLFWYRELTVRETGKKIIAIQCALTGKSKKDTDVSAFLSSELGEILPNSVIQINPNTRRESRYYLHYWHNDDSWYVEYRTPKMSRNSIDVSHCAHSEEGLREVEVLGQMLEYLITNNLLTP